jgi:4'-phosphopantetheinyl transferase
MQRIERGEVHLWYCLVEDVVSQPKLIAACQRLLSQEELDGLARRRRPEVWAEFLVTRALVRATLSAYTTIPPSALRFSTDRRGRPKFGPQRRRDAIRLQHFSHDGHRRLGGCERLDYRSRR